MYHTTTGGQTMVSVSSNNETMPEEIELYQNYPNPFNPVTTIRYSLPQAGYIRLSIFDILGREVQKILSEYQTAGHHNYQLSIDNYKLSSGVYFYKLQVLGSGGLLYSASKKMVISK